jgi:NitT/TauT family transport system permease protein
MQEQTARSAGTVEAPSIETPPAARPHRLPFGLRRALAFLAILIAAIALWEGYKAIGAATRDRIPFTAISLPIRSDDRSMPHVWDIAGALFEPVQRGQTETLLSFLIRAALFTWREALVGFTIGSLVGFALGVFFVHSPLLERGLMPYVVASQTVPLLAIAPMVVVWGGQLGWEAWVRVTIISAYLTFFPVTINTLRGLRSPQPTALELMRSYASSNRHILWKLRVPAALPYIFTALKISATTSVIGAIVGELPSGIADGLGRSLLTFSYYYISGPEKLYAAILVAAALGIAFVSIVNLAERFALPAQRRLAE